ncbi:MAG: acylphosphatase [Armatimonadota bacterium]|nr:acylphosphatase [Armatimonadota bacterium]
MRSADDEKRLVAVVQGRVQGVGFRYFVLDKARDLHLTGIVRNLRNGDVEVIAEGSQGALEALLAALKVGPRAARVDNVHAVWLPATGEYKTFSIAPTR